MVISERVEPLTLPHASGERIAVRGFERVNELYTAREIGQVAWLVQQAERLDTHIFLQYTFTKGIEVGR